MVADPNFPGYKMPPNKPMRDCPKCKHSSLNKIGDCVNPNCNFGSEPSGDYAAEREAYRHRKKNIPPLIEITKSQMDTVRSAELHLKGWVEVEVNGEVRYSLYRKHQYVLTLDEAIFAQNLFEKCSRMKADKLDPAGLSSDLVDVIESAEKDLMSICDRINSDCMIGEYGLAILNVVKNLRRAIR
jgi:hypothetical protein